MNTVLDAADRAFWWLRDHLAAAAALLVALVAVLVLLATAGGSGGKVPAGAVAVVGSAPIRATELTHWQGVYSQAATASGGTQPSATAARKAAFELLAGAAWITEEAKAKRVSVTDAQVDQQIDAYFKQAGVTTAADRVKLQQQLGTSDADMRFQQRVALLAVALQNRVAKAVPAPSAAAVEATYAKEPQRWATPSQRDLRAVITADKTTAAAALEELQGGASFAAVTKKYSTNAELTQKKGVISGLKNGTSGDAVDRVVFSAPTGALQGPVDIGAGFMVFKVQKVTPLPAQTLAQATPAIKASLTRTARATATNAYLDQLHERWKAKTRCTAGITDAEYCAEA